MLSLGRRMAQHTPYQHSCMFSKKTDFYAIVTYSNNATETISQMWIICFLLCILCLRIFLSINYCLLNLFIMNKDMHEYIFRYSQNFLRFNNFTGAIIKVNLFQKYYFILVSFFLEKDADSTNKNKDIFRFINNTFHKKPTQNK